MKILAIVFGVVIGCLQISCQVGVNLGQPRKIEGSSIELSNIKIEILGNPQFKSTKQGNCAHWLRIKLTNSSNKEQKLGWRGVGKLANDATVENVELNGFIFKDTYDSETDNTSQNSAKSENILVSSSPVLRSQSSLQGWLVLKDSSCRLNKRGYHLDRIEFTFKNTPTDKASDKSAIEQAEMIYRVKK